MRGPPSRISTLWELGGNATQRLTKAVRGVRLEEDVLAVQRLRVDANEMAAIGLQARGVARRRKLVLLRVGGDDLAIPGHAGNAQYRKPGVGHDPQGRAVARAARGRGNVEKSSLVRVEVGGLRLVPKPTARAT